MDSENEIIKANITIVQKQIELLAPGGDIDSIKAAIAAGAGAVYCGLNKFNARNRAANINFDDLNGILRLAHKNNCEVFITLNIIIVDSEIPDLIKLLNKLVNTGIDGVIIQDLGLFYILSNYFKSLKIHASTQCTTHNEGQIKFLSKLEATRVNLSRELTIHEIKALTSTAHQQQVLTEVFVHGSNCISFSGLCYISSVQSGNSGNRGRCSQPCRDEYLRTPAGKKYPLNLKDNSAWFDLQEIDDAGVDSIKIEGRIKKFHYVYTVVNAWRKHLDHFNKYKEISRDNKDLYSVFNRGFSNAFFKGRIHKDMFVDNPRDQSVQYLSELNQISSDNKTGDVSEELYKAKDKNRASIETIIKQLSIEKAPLTIKVSGEAGTPLKIVVKTPDNSFELCSEMNLKNTGTEALDYEMLFKRLKAINDTEYFIEQLEVEELHDNLFIPFKELTVLKKRILFTLNDSRKTIEPVRLSTLKKLKVESLNPGLSVLIDSQEDIHLCHKTGADIFFQLPNSFKDEVAAYVDLFKKNEKLIPWFPSILIGDDYQAALALLKAVQPKFIVSNNSGIAYEANREGISWIAGPFLNIANSYSLLCLKENMNCSGAFISNELSRLQMKGIRKPDDFKLYYSIYHPIILMTSRQCLFHQATGCAKEQMDEDCIKSCSKITSITNLNKEALIVEKSKGNYHTIYNAENFLNMEIRNDLPDLFSGFLIDLRNVKTETQIVVDKPEIIKLFEQQLDGYEEAGEVLKQRIHPTTSIQYRKGI